MDWDEAKAKLEGLSEAQLRLLIELAFRELPEDRQEFLVKLASQMKRVNKQDKKGG
ncbi:hypothetical protein ES705_16579 [subsurface metagenome]|jgi:hypothetical protein